MSTEERRVQLVAEVDTTRTRTGFQEIGQQAGQMAQQVTQAGERAEQAVNQVGQQAGAAAQQVSRAGQQAAGAVGNIGANASTSTRNVDSASRSIISSIQRATAAAEAGGRQTAAYYETIARQRGIDPTSLQPYLDQLRAVEKAQGSAGVSAEQTTAAMRQLPAQMSDIVSSLAGGQSPFMVLIQQGGQIKDSFGGVRNAIQAIGEEVKSFFGFTSSGAESLGSVSDVLSGIIDQQDSAAQSGANLAEGLGGAADSANSLAEAGGNAQEALAGVSRTTGILLAGAAAVAAVVAALVYAYKEGSKESDAFVRSIVMSGNAAGTSASQLSSYAAAISKTVGTQAQAAQALAALTSTGKVGAENLKQFGTVAIEVQKYIGRSIEDTAKDFEELGKSPVESILKLDDSYHFLTASVYEQIKALQDQGKSDDAAELAQKTYAAAFADRAAKMKDNLGLIERAWMGAKDSAASAWDVFLGVGRKKTPARELAEVQAQIQLARQPAGTGAGDRGDAAEMRRAAAATKLTELLKREAELQKKIQKDAVDAQAAADQQRIDDAQKQWSQGGEKYLTRQVQLTRDLAAARAEGEVAWAKLDPADREKKITERLADIRRSYADVFNAGVESNIAALQRRDAIEELLAQRSLARTQAQFALGNISEEQSIRDAANVDIEIIDRHITAKRAELAQLQGKIYETQTEKQKALQDKEGEIAQLQTQRGTREEKRENDLLLLQQRRLQASDDLYTKGLTTATAERDSLIQSLGAQLDYNQGIGLTKIQLAEVTAARLENLAALKEEAATAQEMLPGGEELARVYREQAQALRDTASATLGGAARDSAQELQEFLDPARAQSFGEALRNAFGSAGDAMTRLTGSLKDFGARQVEIEKKRGDAAWRYLNGKETEEQYLKNIAALNERSTQSQLAGYGDMAGAAASFFGEHSRGYQSLMAVSQVFHAAELAMTTAELVPKAISAVLTQGEGDPYTAFGRMAAMAALVTGLGVAIGGIGGGSDTTAKDRQAAQGAGTVLADSSAKSQSISRAVQLSAANSSTQIDYLSGMLTSLRAIETGISSFASQIVSGTDIANPTTGLNTNNGLGTTVAGLGLTAGGAALGGMAGAGLTAFTSLGAVGGPLGMAAGALLGYLASKSSFVGKIATSIFGGKQSVEDSGFTMNKATLAAILSNGANASQYADVKTSGGWFHSDKSSTQLTSLGQDANVQFSLVIESLADSITEAGKLMGISGAGFEAQLNSFVVDIGKVSLKDMTGDEIQKALESVFSKLGDQMASYAIGGLQQFQQVGEGYLETLVRVASDYAKVDASLQSIGKTFGSVGLASIAARESLISLMGGIDEFQSQTASFASNFLTKAEQLAPVAKYVDEQLAALGLTGITTRDQFKQVVLGLDLTTAAGQKEYAALMSLQEAFAATHAATVDLSKTEQEVADEKKDLQDQLDQLTMTQTQLLQKQRYALAEANRPLFDMVQAAQKLADTSSSLTKFRDAATSLGDSLLTGSLSVLTPEQQYAELRDQYEKTKAAALAGDTAAQDQVFNALNAWLTASQKLNSGDSQYQADFALAQQDSASMAAWASGQVDTATAQLNAMNSQTAALATVNTALDTANTILTTISQNTAPVAGGANVIGSALSALTMAINALKQDNAKLTDQVAGLRKDQQAQTGDAITSNAETQQSAADRIVSGVTQAVSRLTTNQKVALE